MDATHHILQDLKIVHGPNAWSPRHDKLLVLKLDLSHCSKDCMDYISTWAGENLDLAPYDETKENHLLFVTSVVAMLIKYLQPHHHLLYSDVQFYAPDGYYVIVEYEQEKAGTEAVRLGCRIAESLMEGKESMKFTEAKTVISNLYEGPQ